MYNVPPATTPSGPLEPRWSPATWLRIVHGVWLDQRWYWRTIHPRLLGRRRISPLQVQSLAGSLLIMLGLLLIPALLLFFTEYGRLALQEDAPGQLALRLFPGLLLVVVSSLVRPPNEAVALGAGTAVALGLVLCLYILFQLIVIRWLPFRPDPQRIASFGPPDPTRLNLDLISLFPYFMAWAVGQGLSNVLAHGTLRWGRWNLDRPWLASAPGRWLVGTTWLACLALMALAAIVDQWGRYTHDYDLLKQIGMACMIFNVFPGYLLGASIAMRLVPDPAERLQLARGEDPEPSPAPEDD